MSVMQTYRANENENVTRQKTTIDPTHCNISSLNSLSVVFFRDKGDSSPGGMDRKEAKLERTPMDWTTTFRTSDDLCKTFEPEWVQRQLETEERRRKRSRKVSCVSW